MLGLRIVGFLMLQIVLVLTLFAVSTFTADPKWAGVVFAVILVTNGLLPSLLRRQAEAYVIKHGHWPDWY